MKPIRLQLIVKTINL